MFSGFAYFAFSSLRRPSHLAAAARPSTTLALLRPPRRTRWLRFLHIRLPQRGGPKTAVNPSVRHSFNGSEIGLDLSSVTSTPTTANPGATPIQQQHQQRQVADGSPEPGPKVARINGHVRSGSAGNWGSATAAGRAGPGHLTAYPLSSIPGGDLKASSPWADYNVGSSRLAEKNWA